MENKICGECVHFDGRASCLHRHRGTWGGCEACSEYTERNKPTNGDRIRAMSDEKLVKVIWKGLCGLCPYKGSGNICNNDTDKECHEIILEELKKEVNNG